MSITEAIGYDGEVSEPGGPVVRGYFTDRWAKDVTPRFTRWLARKQAEAWDAGFEACYDTYCRGNFPIQPNPHREVDES